MAVLGASQRPGPADLRAELDLVRAVLAQMDEHDQERERLTAMSAALSWVLGEDDLIFLGDQYPAGTADERRMRRVWFGGQDVAERPSLAGDELLWNEGVHVVICWARGVAGPPVQEFTLRAYLGHGRAQAS